ncbi:hypothetical protein Y032_0009g652 [Ancylostoma ceylanicum]|uniref:Uncharacterized protein n=1 Tax=Ancylostoma ceylanicum TaxID=53326 RepID=A0A016VI79_9BILA|nr:hypothetical protein Y032_0009g652 [Ancylostoma ceylanicum]
MDMTSNKMWRLQLNTMSLPHAQSVKNQGTQKTLKSDVERLSCECNRISYLQESEVRYICISYDATAAAAVILPDGCSDGVSSAMFQRHCRDMIKRPMD